MKPKKIATENSPQSWDCAICAKAFKAANELTFHYMQHSVLELSLGKRRDKIITFVINIEPVLNKPTES